MANLITSLRLIFSAWLVILAFSSNNLFLMFLIVNVCGLSDALDGFVARKYHIESKIGSFLDRLADKIFICPTVLILFYRFWPLMIVNSVIKSFTQGLILVIILLELLLIVSGIYGLFKNLNISSNFFGKRKMVFQSAVVYLWFLSLLIEHYFKINFFYVSIYFIDAILVGAIILAVKSIEGYYHTFMSATAN